jgi:hypothetical protein
VTICALPVRMGGDGALCLAFLPPFHARLLPALLL